MSDSSRCTCPKGWGATPMAGCPIHDAGLHRTVDQPISCHPSPLGMVREWHEAFGQQVRERPDATATDGEVEYRHRIHQEEIDELHEAMCNRDLVAMADAIADGLYVLYGTALSYGIPIDEVMAEVHRSNMTKTHDPERAKYAGKVVVKGEGYEPPRIARILGLPHCADPDREREAVLMRAISYGAFVRNLFVLVAPHERGLLIRLSDRSTGARLTSWIARTYDDAMACLLHLQEVVLSGRHNGRAIGAGAAERG